MDSKLKSVVIGVDIGKKIDFTVVSVVEKHQGYINTAFEGRQKDGKPFLHLVQLKRFPLDTPHNIQKTAIDEMYKRTKEYYNANRLAGEPVLNPYLVIDLGNVGEEYFDEYMALGTNVYGVKVHGGEKTRYEKRRWYVGTENFYSVLGVFYETKRLRIADDIEDRKGIISEFARFTWKLTASGNLTAENLRDADHDDRVDSVATACWFSMHGIREITTGPRPPGL